MICPYCNKQSYYGENKIIYWRNYGASYMCYYCKDCNSYVWTHKNTKRPLWTMADKELRELRIKTHEIFDKLWKNNTMTRPQAYRKLKKYFRKEVHIWESDILMCNRIINYAKKILR